jgi:tetratricopeptide (TPR) repeat protein
MKTFKNNTTGFVLAALLLVCSAATAVSTSELLQQGLYAEEVDGNIDAAIKAYEQVIKKADAPRNHVAQALYRQGMCYLKTKDEQAAKTVLEKLVNEYTDQVEIVEKARPALDDLMDFDPAMLMPADTLVYVELGSPGKQVETILNMLKGTPYENPLAAVGGQSPAGPNQPPKDGGWQAGQKSPGNIMAAFLNPSMMAEFKKIRGSAIGITGVAQNNPPMVAVLYPGKSDAMRGLILAGLSVVGTPGEPIEGMQTLNIKNSASLAYDDRVFIIAQPAKQLEWCVKQYKGLISEPTLASGNPSFAKLSKKQRHNNVTTVWANVDEAYSKVLQMFPQGQVPSQILIANAFVDFANIDGLTRSESIEQDGYSDTLEVSFKEGHHCLAYDLFRTPNISKAALKAVPSDAIAVASLALSGAEPQTSTVRAQIKNITGLDIGREIFANVEQVTLFAMPAKQPSAFFPGYIGLVVTSHNSQQTRQILAKTLGMADMMLTGRPAEDVNVLAGRYQVGKVKDQPIYCYVEEAGNATILSLSPDITGAAVAAVKDGNNVCTAGPLSNAVSKMPASASKLVVVNAGGVIRLAGPAVIESLSVKNRDALQDNFNKIATAADKTTIELRTDEQLNSLIVNSKLTGLPQLNQVFGPIAQITQIIKQEKAEAKAEELRQAAPATIIPAAKSPVIDGKADDVWSSAHQYKLANVLYTPTSSPNDLAASYKATWDQNNLYLFVDVTDDILKNDSAEPYNDDSVEVFIDAKNSKSPKYGETDYAYIFRCDKANPEIRENSHNRTEGVQCATETVDGGYRMEIKFPWSTLGTKPKAGAKIGLDVHVNDDDDGGDRDTKITWHDKKDDAWQNPQSFGNAELAGLVGWWKFDEKEGSAAADSSGNGNDGTLQGGPVWRPQGGKLGGALEFDGKRDYVEIANESNFDITGQITISAWANITSVPQEWTGIVTKGDSAWRISTDFANNIFHFGLSANDYLNGKTTVGSGQWHHVLCVYDGRKMSIYVDGKLDTSKPREGAIGTNDYPVCIGENIQLTGRFWHGLIDDVRVYNYALSENEIAAIAAGQ